MIEPIAANSGTFDAMGQGAIALLESITAAEKAQAVPHVEIWRINPETGVPVFGFGSQNEPKYPLTLSSIAPPNFGSSVDQIQELRERPDASIESITIKSVNPAGLILYRQIDISLMVHRPEALAVVQRDRDSWRDLITPGAVFAMRYGWSANSKHVKNPILNGNDETIVIGKKSFNIQGSKIIRFAITNYRFTVLPDQQIQINISAIEDGDYGLRQTYVVPGVRPSSQEKRMIGYDSEKFSREFTVNADKKIQDLTNSLRNKVFKGPAGNVVRMEDIFDIFFVQQAEDTIKALGYSYVKFKMGSCNAKVPTPHPQYAWRQKTYVQNTPEKYIGDFTVPFDDVVKRMSDMVMQGHELTIFNFIKNFLAIMQDPRVWSNLESGQVTMPEVQMKFRSFHNKDTGKQWAEVYVFDAKVELVRFTTDDKISYQEWAKKNSQSQAGVQNRDKIRDICLGHGVPYIEFMKANSWIQDAQFDVIQDELIQSIFITRYYQRDRAGDVSRSSDQLRDEEINHRATLYSSAIKGQITCIGNHVMDTMGLYWIDFSVPQWSGPFRILETTDLIQMGGWQTTISVISDGSDPVGSQGRITSQTNPNTNTKVGFEV